MTDPRIFRLPYPVRPASVHTAWARQESFEWFTKQGMLTNDADKAAFQSWDLTSLMGMSARGASANGVLMAANCLNFCGVVDDVYDGPRWKDATAARRGAERLCGVFEGEQDDWVLARGFAGVWSQLSAGRSPQWCARAAEHWRWYFECFEAESLLGQQELQISQQDYLDLRLRSGFTLAIFDWLEAAFDFETSERVQRVPEVRRMLELGALVVSVTNDVHSVEKEAIHGGTPNMVLLIERDEECSREEALERTCAWMRQQCAEIIKLDSRLADACLAAGVPLVEIEGAERVVRAMEDLISAGVPWGEATGRYRRLNKWQDPLLDGE
ncbi:terpene synthase family protein [Streptomyces ficellus]|uniref:Terpene synthase n=1 Tax=Streptomyces ficellus TaxID=1977088 RepID=A0ABT7Z3V6_9ACTN|nr:terpene synthase family protein [Streptomyces ficellus]MDN3294173.1 terpene synthase family protein [Streptomyces ficellus]